MHGNGGMQPSYATPTDNTCPTDGGSTVIVTGDEWPYINKQEKMTVRTGTLSFEDDSHVQGIYRESDFAGS